MGWCAGKKRESWICHRSVRKAKRKITARRESSLGNTYHGAIRELQLGPSTDKRMTIEDVYFAALDAVRIFGSATNNPLEVAQVRWAHLRSNPVNIGPTIPAEKIEEILNATVVARFIGVCDSYGIPGDLLPLLEVSENCSACQEWWARLEPNAEIQRQGNGDVVFTVSGRLAADNVSELAAMLAAGTDPRAGSRGCRPRRSRIFGSCGRPNATASPFATVRRTSANGSRVRKSSHDP